MNQRRKTKRVPLDAIVPGPIQHDQLPDALLKRIRVVHERLRDVYRMNLEEFEIGFMRDTHPEAEVSLWECMADATDDVCAQGGVDRDAAYSTILVLSVGPAEQIADVGLRELCVRCFAEAKAKRAK